MRLGGPVASWASTRKSKGDPRRGKIRRLRRSAVQMHVPTSRSKKKIYMSVVDLCWALVSPLVALYVGSALALTQQNWSMVALYCALSSGFAIVAFLAFRLQDGITQHFSAHDALDVAEAVLVAELMTCG